MKKKFFCTIELVLIIFSITVFPDLFAQSSVNTPGNINNFSKGSLIFPSDIEKNKESTLSVTPAPKPEEIKPPSGTYEEFLFYESKCKQLKDSNCVVAGKIIMSERPPQQIFDLTISARAKKAIRLYEIAITMENLDAMEAAYDLYFDPFTAVRLTNSYTDTQRAMELREMMINKNFPAGFIRQAIEYLDNPEYAISYAKKKEACQIFRKYEGELNISEESKKIINEIKSGVACKLL
jgi:hypothetical protein